MEQESEITGMRVRKPESIPGVPAKTTVLLAANIAACLWLLGSAYPRSLGSRAHLSFQTRPQNPPIRPPRRHPCEISVADYGADPTGRQDSTPAFLRSRDVLRANNPNPCTLMIPPGRYALGTAGWLKGVQNVFVSGYGATIVMTTNGQHSYTVDDYACNFGGDIFSDSGDGDFTPARLHDGKPLGEELLAGQTSLKLRNPADAAEFAQGTPVLIYGFDARPGALTAYPPDPKYFQFDRVLEVDSSAGILTLEAPSTYLFRTGQDWADTTYLGPDTGPGFTGVTVGGSRVLPLSRPTYQIAESIEVAGLSFSAAPNGKHSYSNGAIGPSGALSLFLIDVSATGIYVGEVQNFECLRCTIWPDAAGNGATETDKIVDQALFQDSLMYMHTQGTGVNDLTFSGSQLFGPWQARGRRQTYINCDIHTDPFAASMVSAGSSFFIESLDVLNNRFYPPVSARLSGLVGDGNLAPLVVDAVANAGNGLNELLIKRAGNDSLANSLEVGAQITTSGDLNVKVFDITGFRTDPVYYRIQVRPYNSAIPVPGATYFLWTTNRVRYLGNIAVAPGLAAQPASVTGSVLPSIAPSATGGRARSYLDEESTSATRIMRVNLASAGYYGAYVRGLVTKLEVDVQRPYTGADSKCLVTINHAIAPFYNYGTIDCRQPGIRVLGSSITGGLPGDSLRLPDRKTYAESIQVKLSNGLAGQSLSASSDAELPIISIRIESVPFDVQ